MHDEGFQPYEPSATSSAQHIRKETIPNLHLKRQFYERATLDLWRYPRMEMKLASEQLGGVQGQFEAFSLFELISGDWMSSFYLHWKFLSQKLG